MNLTEPRTWFRSIVPSGYSSALLTLEGTSPLLMNSAEADPESAEVRAFVQLSRTKKKTDDLNARLRELEWKLRLYYDADIGPYIPAKNIKEMLRRAATKWTKGEEIKRSLAMIQHRVPLLYDGPRDEADLWAAGYRYITKVRNNGPQGGRVDRCRPMFPTWRIETEVAFDPEALDFHVLEEIVEYSRRFGLGDYRPTFGTFTSGIKLIQKQKGAARGSAKKAIDAVEQDAESTFSDMIRETA